MNTLSPDCAQSLAVAAAFTAGAVLGLLAFDGIVWLLIGNTATVSHAMSLLGVANRWLPWVWCASGYLVVTGLAVHFWGWPGRW